MHSGDVRCVYVCACVNVQYEIVKWERKILRGGDVWSECVMGCKRSQWSSPSPSLSLHPLWLPGSELVDLVDCRSGLILPNIPAKQFWVGFEDVRHRLVDHATEEPMLLKLKDWPPSEDFSEKLPRRYEDFMQTLPLGEYARRDGKLNTASRWGMVGRGGEGKAVVAMVVSVCVCSLFLLQFTFLLCEAGPGTKVVHRIW